MYLIRRRGGSSSFAPAADSKAWSCALVVACGSLSGLSTSHHVVLTWRCDGRRRVPEIKKKGGLLCALLVFSFKFMGATVKWVCTVRVRAI